MRVGLLLILSALPMMGCGSNGYSTNFVGTWRGKVTTTLGTASQVVAVVQPVTSISSSQFRFSDWIASTVWTADSQEYASVQPTRCPTQRNGNCEYGLSVESGIFVRHGEDARFAIFGTATVLNGCGAAPGTVFSYSATSDLLHRQ